MSLREELEAAIKAVYDMHGDRAVIVSIRRDGDGYAVTYDLRRVERDVG